MKKLLSGVGVVILALALIPAAASAKDKSGAVGVGYDNTIGDASGLSVRYQVAKSFGIQAILGFSTTSYDNGESGDGSANTSDTNTTIALRGNIGLAFTKKTNLDLILGVNIYNESHDYDNPGDGDDDNDGHTSFNFELGLGAHYFFTDWFSINGEVGLAFATIGDQKDVGRVASGLSVVGDKGDGTELVFGKGDGFGSFGWTFWFN
jgi:hypothetical protein